MRNLKGAVAVITGAGSGIGRALAQRLAREGCRLALADLSEAGLADTGRLAGSPDSLLYRLDVADWTAMEQFAAAVPARFGQADLLVNNAGVALVGSVEQASIEDMRWLMEINFWGMVHGVKAFLPQLKARPEAHIVNLSSVFGLVGPEGQAIYAASKFAVRGFSEALRHELAGTGVRVSTVHPGGVKTAIAESARISPGVSQGTRKALLTAFERLARTTPEAAADRIVAGILADAPRILVGPDARVIDVVQRLRPVGYGAWLSRLGLGRRRGRSRVDP